MYKKGYLKITDIPCNEDYEDGYCDNIDHCHRLHGSTDRAAYLPHSCDEWLIGGKEQIKDLIEDLQEALKKFVEVEERGGFKLENLKKPQCYHEWGVDHITEKGYSRFIFGSIMKCKTCGEAKII